MGISGKMASGTRAYKQDLPPKGGYAPIQKVRIPAKQWMGGYWPAVFGMGILSAQWWLFFRKNREETKKKQLEMRGMQLAFNHCLPLKEIEPLLNIGKMSSKEKKI